MLCIRSSVVYLLNIQGGEIGIRHSPAFPSHSIKVVRLTSDCWLLTIRRQCAWVIRCNCDIEQSDEDNGQGKDD